MKRISLFLTSLLLVTSCNSNENSKSNTSSESLSAILSSSLSSSIKDEIIFDDTIIKSPNEDGGMEGNAEDDLVVPQDTNVLKNFLLKVANEKYYSYEVTSTVSGSETHFFNYFTPYAWYEENDNPALSFGYAEEIDTGAVFKYYLNETQDEAIPSIYEYTGYNNDISKLLSLYSPLAITHINLLLDNMDDFSAISVGVNKFLITDYNIASIFQFMTTFGTSIIEYINSTYIEIISFNDNIFKATCDLGEYGKIEGVFRPDKNSKIKFVNDAIINGELKGVDYYEDVYNFLNVKMNNNNFILHGVKQPNNENGLYTIHCTNNYFYLKYDKEIAPNYDNYGFMIIPKGQKVTFYPKQENGEEISVSQTLNYSACYKFKERADGTYYFSDFIGPIESAALKYLEVDALPNVGETNTLYIVEENGKKVAYEWRETTNENNETIYKFFVFDEWLNSVGDYFLNESGATFYLSSTPLSTIGAHYFEQDKNNPNIYTSKDVTIMGELANSLFGWGFNASTSWMSYIRNSRIRINKDSNNEILSYDIGLDLLASFNGNYGLHEIYYTIDGFNEANIQAIDDFLLISGGVIDE